MPVTLSLHIGQAVVATRVLDSLDEVTPALTAPVVTRILAGGGTVTVALIA